MNRFRTVGARLTLALLAVVIGALAIVYAVVVPSLERTLVESKLSQLQASAETLAPLVPRAPWEQQQFAEAWATTVNARIVVGEVLVESPVPAFAVHADSNPRGSSDVEEDPVALAVAAELRPQRATVRRAGRLFGEVAVPLTQTGSVVLLLTAPLDDTVGSVDRVRDRVLLAGLLALGVSLGIGFGASVAFARRIRRLERAADRIAAGSFDEPVEDDGRDEVGELASAFERMRLRLAQLEHARREFIANASHELRTPLFSLGGFLELIRDEDLDERTRREFLATMGEQVDRLTKLATDLLDLSRLDAGRLAIEREPLDLSEIARTLAGEFEPLARSREHRLEIVADGPVPAVGDEQRALQIGRILIENALLHTPPGTRVRLAARSNGRGELIVEDEGPGIPQEHAEHVFERFYRVEGAVASGSGLGLAIARELAELMGGEVELEASNGATRFSLALPVG